MSRSTLLDYSFVLLCAAGCSQAYADQPIAGPQLPQARIALDVAPAKVRAPYDVQVMRENGETAPTYAFRDRYYVQGNVNERYVIRVTNPTPNRVEAVVTVDGLDVIDGENGDLRKRGYVVPPYGETRIEGFRTSEADVATFRFSSVGGSYAGIKGKARNVGVIAVAIFEEQHAVEGQQKIIVGQAGPPVNRKYDYTDDLDARRGAMPSAESKAESSGTSRGSDRPKASPGDTASHGHRIRGEKKTAAADKEAPAATGSWGGGGAVNGAPSPAAPPAPGRYRNYDADDEGECCDQPNYQPPPQQRERLGLGTEFGEQRYSAAQYTRFVRAANRPIAIAELRYNDAAGLMALGINVGPMPDQAEVMTRETADPFPGDHFARPPR